MLCALLCLLPNAQLGQRMINDLPVARGERAGLPANQAWQRMLEALNAHRLAAAAPPANLQAQTARRQAQEKAAAAMGDLSLALTQ